MARLGWTPDKKDAEAVPLLRESSAFLMLEAERSAARYEMGCDLGAEVDLEALWIAQKAGAEQMKLFADIAKRIEGRIDDDAVRFWSWGNIWRYRVQAESDGCGAEFERIRARIEAQSANPNAVADAVSQRVEARWDSILSGRRKQWTGIRGAAGGSTVHLAGNWVIDEASGVRGRIQRVLGEEELLVRLEDGRVVRMRPGRPPVA